MLAILRRPCRILLTEVCLVCPQVIAESSHICIVEVLQHTQAPKLLRQSLEVGVGDRDPRLRARCMEYTTIMLQCWSTPAIEKSIAAVDDAIRKGMTDANSDARSAARRSFWAIKPRWPERAQKILSVVDPSTQRLLLK